jgi:hypothetical protein
MISRPQTPVTGLFQISSSLISVQGVEKFFRVFSNPPKILAYFRLALPNLGHKLVAYVNICDICILEFTTTGALGSHEMKHKELEAKGKKSL